jgi:hypothetical protein
VFAAAGIYKGRFWSGLAVDPQWFFRLSGLPSINHPAIFACLGMVVGFYGNLYFEVARDPERGRLIEGVGRLGKILGPAGMAYLIVNEAWPTSAVILIVGNDLFLWIPFSLYLYDASMSGETVLSAGKFVASIRIRRFVWGVSAVKRK